MFVCVAACPTTTFVEAGDHCDLARDPVSLSFRQCKKGLLCIFGICRVVQEHAVCSRDEQCTEPGDLGLRLVCIAGRCQSRLEAGEACSIDAQCFSGSCIGGTCRGASLGEACSFSGSDRIERTSTTIIFRPGPHMFYQNLCGMHDGDGLYCQLGHSQDGEQSSVCALPLAEGQALPRPSPDRA